MRQRQDGRMFTGTGIRDRGHSTLYPLLAIGIGLGLAYVSPHALPTSNIIHNLIIVAPPAVQPTLPTARARTRPSACGPRPALPRRRPRPARPPAAGGTPAAGGSGSAGAALGTSTRRAPRRHRTTDRVARASRSSRASARRFTPTCKTCSRKQG
eukprot:scaffold9724_cov146-Isochrysis_galbana.AAC.2